MRKCSFCLNFSFLRACHEQTINKYFCKSFNFTENNNTTINNNNSSSLEHESSSSSGTKDRDKVRDGEKDRIRNDRERKHDEHNANSASPKRPRSRDVVGEREKNWNYPPGLDIMATGAFWQNYSGK